MPLAERIAIVTGAGAGMGRAYAHWFAARGCHVVVNNRVHQNRPSAAQIVAAEIEAAGGRATVDESDLADWNQAGALVDNVVARLGRVDILVCNAAVMPTGPFEAAERDVVETTFAINVLGVIASVRSAWAHMKARGYGRIVLTGSSGALYGYQGSAVYGASKAAILGLARGLVHEAPVDVDIKINVVVPFAHTKMSAPHANVKYSADRGPEKVAPIVGWLADEACNQTGLILHVGAGRLSGVRFLESDSIDAERVGEEGWCSTLKNIVSLEEASSATDASLRVVIGGPEWRALKHQSQ